MEHIEHLEDLAFKLDDWSLRTLATALIHRVYGAEIGQLSVKIDGAPAIVFGVEYDQSPGRRPFLSTKSYFNKKPIKWYSKDEIKDSGRNPNLIEKLLYYWDQLYSKDRYLELRTGDVFVADVLRDPWCNITEERSRPNILEYHITKDPFCFNNDFLLYIHTYIPSKGFFQGPGYDEYPEYIPYWKKIAYNPKLGCTDSLNYALKKTFYLTEELSLPNRTEREYKEHLKDINTCYRQGKDPLKEYSHWYKGYSFRNWRQLSMLKRQLLAKLDQERSGSNRTWKTYYNGEECPDEGYVFKYRNWTCKLVDRMTFSKRNFDANSERGWKKS